MLLYPPFPTYLIFLLNAIMQRKTTFKKISPQANPAPFPNARDKPIQHIIFKTTMTISAEKNITTENIIIAI